MAPHRKIRRHKAITVHVGDMKEQIDVLLAPLIRAIWKAGIRTIMSCQETEPGISWIEFESADDLGRFLNIVAEYEEGADTLYNRISNWFAGPMSAPSWEYQLNLFDYRFGVDDYKGPTDFLVCVSVYFPHGDLPILLERLQRHNAAISRQA